MMPKTALLFLLLAPGAYAQPDQYMKNDDIKTDVSVMGDNVSFTFGFKDTTEQYQEWNWQDSMSKLDSEARLFGLDDAQGGQHTPQQISRGMFRMDPMVGLLPDYSALASRYYDSVTDLFNRWQSLVDGRGYTKRQAVETLLLFLQDFPYGEVPMHWEGRDIGGLFVPPLIFKNGWADCDSKSLTMATVLSHDPTFVNKTAIVLVPGHAFLGIEMEPSPYDKVYTYQNRTYVVAEPTGLARTPLGQPNSPYDQLLAVEPIHLDLNRRNETAPPPQPAETPNTGVTETSFGPATKLTIAQPPVTSEPKEIRELTKADCPPGGILTDTHPPGGVRVQACYVSRNGDIVRDGPEIRFDENGTPVERKDYSMGVLK